MPLYQYFNLFFLFTSRHGEGRHSPPRTKSKEQPFIQFTDNDDLSHSSRVENTCILCSLYPYLAHAIIAQPRLANVAVSDQYPCVHCPFVTSTMSLRSMCSQRRQCRTQVSNAWQNKKHLWDFRDKTSIFQHEPHFYELFGWPFG